MSNQDLDDYVDEETNSQKSINLLNFEANHVKDQFLLDIYSDRTEFGGISETTLQILEDSSGPFLRLETKLIPDRSGLLPIDYMFGGFRCDTLFKNNFDGYNGFRIKMRKPMLPCKFGVTLTAGLSEYEMYTGHILDTK